MEKLLQDYKTYLAVKYRKKHTYKTYLNAAKRFLEHTEGTINQETIAQYVIYLNQQYKQNTISMYIQGLDILLEYLNLEHLHIPIPQGEDTNRDTINLGEIQKILQYISTLDLQTQIIFNFVAEFDCRPHEITKAKWNDIRGNKIYFNDCKTGNNYNYISIQLQLLLDQYKKQQRFKNKYILVNQHGRYRGKKLSDNGWVIRETIKKITKKIIGRCLTPQDIRASVITEEYNHYINPKTIQRKARHRSQKTTLKYNHVDDRQLEEYISQGTIFSNNNNLISKPKSNDNRSYINTLPQELEEDTNNVSFSFFFSFGFGGDLVKKQADGIDSVSNLSIVLSCNMDPSLVSCFSRLSSPMGVLGF